MAAITPTSTDMRLGTATVSTGTAGEAISAFELLYLKASDGKLWLSVNSAEESAGFYGVAVQDAATDEKVAYVPATLANTIQSATPLWTKGQSYVVGDTAGQMMNAADPAAGDYITSVGMAISTTELYFNPAATAVSV